MEDYTKTGLLLIFGVGLFFLGIIAFSQNSELHCIQGATNATHDKEVSVEIIQWCMENF